MSKGDSFRSVARIRQHPDHRATDLPVAARPRGRAMLSPSARVGFRAMS